MQQSEVVSTRSLPGSSTPMSDTRMTRSDFEPAVKTGTAQTLTRPSLSYWQDAWIRLKKNKQALASLGIVVALLLFTLFGPFVWTIDPAAQDINRISEGPSFGSQAVVLGDPEAWEDTVLSNVPETPADSNIVGADLAAPASIQVVGTASVLGVGLRWDSVPGAAGYVVYKSLSEPKASSQLGLPVGEVEGGNKVSYQDQFNLVPGTFYYSVLAKNVDESNQFATMKVELASGISLMNAQAINPEIQVGQSIQLPSHPLGTDYMGRDMLARLMAGARVSLFIGIFAPLLWIGFGVMLGGVSGYFGGRVDQGLMRITDFVLALPFLLFMILFKVVFGAGAGESGIAAMLVAMVILSWTGAARLTRGQILQLRESEFVQASRLLGARSMYLIVRHLLPNTMGVILVSLTFAIPSAIFTEAFLSFIGMGVVPPTPSWGSMCNDGINTFLTHPHEFIFPALLISVSVLAFNLLGDGLRDALDPRLRSRE